jgi:hypothetical protein
VNTNAREHAVTIILDLPNELERELSQEAAQKGLPLAEYALQLLAANRVPAAESTPPRTGAELVAFWEREGLLGGGPDIEDPVTYARELRECNQNRRLADGATTR